MDITPITRRRPRARPGPAFHLAQSSLKKIHAVIRAYFVIGRSATLEEVRGESQQSQAAINNMHGFLVDMGILMGSPRRNQLRPLGLELGKALRSRKGDRAINGAWKRIVCSNLFCLQLLKDARAEGKMDRNRFIYRMFEAAGYRPRELSHDYSTGAKALISIFKRAGLVRRSSGYLTVSRSIEKVAERQRGGTRGNDDFILQDRILCLEEIQSGEAAGFDLSRLITCCHELNDNYRRGNAYSVLLLSRAILDHVPPVFGEPDFETMAAHTHFPELKAAANNLLAFRAMAGAQIRQRDGDHEAAAGPDETDFKMGMDFLIGQVIELVRQPGQPGRSGAETQPEPSPDAVGLG